MNGTSTTFRPREAGEGDHAKRGGGGLGMEACSNVDTCPYRLAEPVIGPATSGRTRWLATSSARGGGKRNGP
jgi:hypothetical protein